MRQPSFSSRRPSRQYRLMRTGIIIVSLVAIVALVGRIFGEDREAPPDRVRFLAATTEGPNRCTLCWESDGERPPAKAVAAESQNILDILDDWYQRAFVDPSMYGDGTFSEVAAHFAEEARARFAADRATLTIGEARTEIKRVKVQQAAAAVTVFFENGEKPRFATAHVTFRARGTLKTKDAMPLQIVSNVRLSLEHRNDNWVITFYDASQKQDSIKPAARRSP